MMKEKTIIQNMIQNIIQLQILFTKNLKTCEIIFKLQTHHALNINLINLLNYVYVNKWCFIMMMIKIPVELL